MDDDKTGDGKSIRQRIADALKDIAKVAANAANDALKAETPKPETRKSKSDEAAATYIPLAAEGLVSDPMLVPPLAAAAPAPKKKRGAAKPAAKKAVRKTAKKATKKSAVGKSKKSARKTVKNAAKKSTRQTAKKNKKRAAQKVRTPTRRRRAKA